jgi:hypothetical protein
MRPFLILAVQLPRHKQTLSDQLVLGLVTGGLLGPGLFIETRESDCIRFRKRGGPLQAAPDRGEIRLTTEASGDTRVECRIWCRSLFLRRLIGGILLAVGMAGLIAAGLWVLKLAPRNQGLWTGTVGMWTGAVGLLTALVSSTAGRRMDRARLRRQVQAYLHNTTYLKAI